jgi:antirestriction protein
MTHHLTTSVQHSNALDATPSIYVACLAAYNNGKLHGTWIDATQEPDAIMGEVRAMLGTSPEPDAEEWAIHDYDNFHGLRLSEWEGFAKVHAYATFIAEHGRLGAELIAYTGDIEQAMAMMSDGYAGCFESLADFAQELTEDITTIPQNLTGYIDFERMAADMEMSGDILTIETAHDEVHVFWRR